RLDAIAEAARAAGAAGAKLTGGGLGGCVIAVADDDAHAVRIGAPLTLAFADSGHPGSTAKAVGSVQALREREPESTDALLSRLAEIAEGSIAELAAGDRTAIGAAMTEAHGILNRVGVSSERLDAIAEAARAAGAAGAKLTGGGLGGCVIAVADDDAHADRIGAAMRRAGAERTWTVEVPAA
ncbi:hypothetical protein BMH28_14770, partial [Leucobacter sp. OLCS4]